MAVHRNVWVEEWRRLDNLSSFLEGRVRQFLESEPSEADSTTGQEITTTDILVDFDEYEEKQELWGRETASRARGTVAALRTFRAEYQKVVSGGGSIKEVQTAFDIRQAGNDTLKVFWENYELESKQLDAEFSSLTAHGAPRLPADDADLILNPWVEHDGKIVKFLDVSCLDPQAEQAAIEEYFRLRSAYETSLSTHPPSSPEWVSHSMCARVRKLLDEYKGAVTILVGGWRGWWLERVKLETGLRRQDCKMVESYAMSCQKHMKNQQNLEESLLSAISSAVAKALSQYDEASRKYLESQRRRLQNQELLERRIVLTEKVHKWRRGKLERLQRQEKERAERVAQEELHRQQLSQLEHQEREKERQRIREWTQRLRQRADEWKKLAAHLEAEWQEEWKHVQANNKARIEHRHQLYQQRLAEREADKVEEQERDLQRIQRLRQLAQSVAPEVASDWERILSDTTAFKGHRHDDENPIVDVRKEWSVLGYSNEQVFRDKRKRWLKANYFTPKRQPK
ncbi:hypothetical protein BC832DRAFT_536364 [Gaertneriomyces semiglobifer]|nr:hypothetical protein BC832DRAFT_536364 [Gaertneriomyces semiglobifer]